MPGVPASRGYRGGFSAALMLKDLGLATAAADTCGAPLHMGRRAAQLYKQVQNAFKGYTRYCFMQQQQYDTWKWRCVQVKSDADFGAVFRDLYAGGIEFGKLSPEPATS